MPVVDLNGALAGTSETLAYTENQALTPIAPAATVIDGDSPNFDTGVLTVEFTAGGDADDRLGVLDQGFGEGEISVSESDILYRPIGSQPEDVFQIAVVNGGTDGATPLVFALTSFATPEATQALIRRIGYFSVSENPTGSRTLSYTLNDGDGDTSAAAIATINLTPVSDPATANADNVTTDEATVFSGSVFIDNGNGEDTDPDGPPFQVTQVNGNPVNVGQQLTLASGAKLTLRADGSFDYDPNGQFNTLTSTSSGQTGAVNTQASDSFAYTITGGSTATVSVTVEGLAGPDDQLAGDGDGNTITGTTGVDAFRLEQGGDDIADGGDGDDSFFFGPAFTGADQVDGGPGANDQIGLRGNYVEGFSVVLGPNTIAGIEVIALLPGPGATQYDYSLTTVDANVPAGTELTIFAGNLRLGEDFTFNGSAETNGRFRIFAGGGTDTILAGSGDDGIYFGPGKFNPAVDRVNGGPGTNDQLALDGDYTVTLSSAAIQNIEALALLRGADIDTGDYNITIDNSLVGPGQTFTLWGMPVEKPLLVNGVAETDGNLRVYGGKVADVITTGLGFDWIWGGLGGDVLNAGAGPAADTFAYDAVAQSTGGAAGDAYDRITGFAAGIDKFDLPGLNPVTGIDPTVAGGTLSGASFNADLAAAIGAGQLAPGHAVLFQPTSGGLAGLTFLVIDANGGPGYQADADYVMQLLTIPGALATTDFV